LESLLQEPPIQFGGEDLDAAARRRRKAFLPSMTSIVVRNIPARYNQDDLVHVWPAAHYKYDFMFLPYSNEKQHYCGHAFINFCSHEAACDFWDEVSGTRLPGGERVKRLDAAVADIQGFQEHMHRWGSLTLTSLKTKQFLPAVFKDSVRVSFGKQVSLFRKMNHASRANERG